MERIQAMIDQRYHLWFKGIMGSGPRMPLFYETPRYDAYAPNFPYDDVHHKDVQYAQRHAVKLSFSKKGPTPESTCFFEGFSLMSYLSQLCTPKTVVYVQAIPKRNAPSLTLQLNSGYCCESEFVFLLFVLVLLYKNISL